jgi:hypothetical protein
MLTQEKLKSLLTYVPESGQFFWNESGKGREASLDAGTLLPTGYIHITIEGERYVAHRLAWLYMTGVFPEEELDHIDRDRANNIWLNLREATRSENAMNQQIRTDNISGHRGICWDKQKNKWKVQISAKGVSRIQKHFVNFDEAVEFYEHVANALFGQYKPEPSSRAEVNGLSAVSLGL